MKPIIKEGGLQWTIIRPSGLDGDDGAGNCRAKVRYSFAESTTTMWNDLVEFIVDELE
jgi:hypothetical protein